MNQNNDIEKRDSDGRPIGERTSEGESQILLKN